MVDVSTIETGDSICSALAIDTPRADGQVGVKDPYIIDYIIFSLTGSAYPWRTRHSHRFVCCDCKRRNRATEFVLR